MERSESILDIAKALVNAQGEFEPIKKQVLNEYYGVKYAPLDEVIRATRVALSKNGLSFTQDIVLQEQTVSVTTTLFHLSGEWIKSSPLTLPGVQVTEKGTKFNAQSVGSAITYARRYSLQALLGVAAEEDDDSEAATHPDKKMQLQEAIEALQPRNIAGITTEKTETTGKPRLATEKSIKEQVTELRESLDKAIVTNAAARLKTYALKTTNKTDVRTISKDEWGKIIVVVREAILANTVESLFGEETKTTIAQ